MIPENIVKIIGEKIKDEQNNGKLINTETFFDEITKEATEAKKEFKKNNSVYLEDELGDIFWDFINLIIRLENDGYIKKENVFTRSEKKFTERTKGLISGELWENIKKKQKEELKKEHIKKYG